MKESKTKNSLQTMQQWKYAETILILCAVGVVDGDKQPTE